MGRGANSIHINDASARIADYSARATRFSAGLDAAVRERERRVMNSRDAIQFQAAYFQPRRVERPRLKRHYTDEFIGALAHEYVERASATRRPVVMEDFEDIVELGFNSLTEQTGVVAEKTEPRHPGTDIVLRRRDSPRRMLGRISLKASAPAVKTGDGRLFRIHNFVRWNKPIKKISDLHGVFDKLDEHRDYDDLLILRTSRLIRRLKNGPTREVIFPASSERWRQPAWYVQLLSLPTQYFESLSERLDAGELDVRMASSGSGRATVSHRYNDEVGTPFSMVVDPYSKQLFLDKVDQFACTTLGEFYVPSMDSPPKK